MHDEPDFNTEVSGFPPDPNDALNAGYMNTLTTAAGGRIFFTRLAPTSLGKNNVEKYPLTEEPRHYDQLMAVTSENGDISLLIATPNTGNAQKDAQYFGHVQRFLEEHKIPHHLVRSEWLNTVEADTKLMHPDLILLGVPSASSPEEYLESAANTLRRIRDIKVEPMKTPMAPALQNLTDEETVKALIGAIERDSTWQNRSSTNHTARVAQRTASAVLR